MRVANGSKGRGRPAVSLQFCADNRLRGRRLRRRELGSCRVLSEKTEGQVRRRRLPREYTIVAPQDERGVFLGFYKMRPRVHGRGP